MVSNDQVLKALGLYAKLAELHGENEFKIRAYNTAAFNLKKIREPFGELGDADWKKIPGANKSVIEAIGEMLHTNTFQALQELLEKTPAGVVELFQVKGLGPKKVSIIWHQLGIENLDGLFNACRENRLVEVKGFGVKTQQEILQNMEFMLAAKGKWHFAKLEPLKLALKELMEHQYPGVKYAWVGEVARCCEVVENPAIITDGEIELTEIFEGWNLQVEVVGMADFDRICFEKTASGLHLERIGYQGLVDWKGSETATYESLGLPCVIAEMREPEVEKYQFLSPEKIITFKDIKGTLHNHTTYSDGLNTLVEMADYAREMGLEYLGVCDHSQSATYANGLREDRLLQQMDEIAAYNEGMAKSGLNFRVFSGIESDILGNGDLDYPDEILAQLDLVVASIHSNLSMTEEKAMSRLIAAIENPYTTILGHPTGRLLLLRNGYPIDHKKIIDACVANGVVIELNANPYRLDMDWRHLFYAIERGAMISINPDAHQLLGYHDMEYGTLAARKAGVPTGNVLNTFSVSEISRYFRDRKI